MILAEFEKLVQTPADVERLNEAILELAVRGRLVAQDPADEPASALLARIRAEKARLETAGEIRKSKPLAKVKAEEMPFALPEGWVWARFDSVAYIATNSTNPDDFLDLPHVAPNNIEKGSGKLLEYSTVGEDGVRSVKHRFFAGQLLYSKIRPNLAKAVLVDFEGLCSADMYPIDSFIDRKFLLYFMLSGVFIAMATKQDTRVAMPKINQTELSKIPVPLPPLAEQQRIVERVDSLLAATAALKESLAGAAAERETLTAAALHRLENAADPAQSTAAWALIRENFAALIDTTESVAGLKQTILQLAVQGKLVAQEPDDEPAAELLARIRAEKARLEAAGEIRKSKPLAKVKAEEMPFPLPVGWVWCRFDSVAYIATNSTSPDDFLDLPHVAPNNIEKGTGKLLEYSTVGEDGVRSIKHRFFAGQLLYSKIRPNLAKAVLVDFEGLCSADMYPIDCFIDRKYLLYFMLSGVFVDMATRQDTRVAMPKINQTELSKIPVPLPPLAEQQRIVERVEALFARCDGLAAELAGAEETRERWVAAVLAGVCPLPIL